NLKRRIIANRKSQLMQLDSRKHVSGKSGAIQPSACFNIGMIRLSVNRCFFISKIPLRLK
ncbi:hypothetical protein, partial [Nitrosomonas ureae]